MDERRDPRVPGYEIRSLLGRGGMGEVFRAEQLSLERDVAIKVFHSGIKITDELKARFRREVEIQSELAHPNLVRVYDGDVTGQLWYLVMELIEGTSLKTVIESHAPLPLDMVLSVSQALAEALVCLHQRNILHRDLKPANILVSQEGEVKVTDFGLAKIDDTTSITKENQVLGTIRYLAPEVIYGGDLTPALDIFAFGLIAHEMLTGELPYRGMRFDAWLDHVQEVGRLFDGEGPSSPAGLEELFCSIFNKDPHARPKAEQVLESLRRLRGGTSGATLVGLDSLDGRPTRDGPQLHRPVAGTDLEAVTTVPTEPWSHVDSKDTVDLHSPRIHSGVIGLGLGLICLGLLAILWRDPVIRLVGDIQVLRGPRTVALRWKTDRPAKTTARVWPASQKEAMGRIVAGPATGVTTRVHHLLFTELDPGSRFRARPLVPGDRGPANSVPIALLSTDEPLITDVRVRYESPSSARITWSTRQRLRSGIELKTGGEEPRTLWSGMEPSSEHRIQTSLRSRDSYTVRFRIHELEDEIDSAPIHGSLALVERFQSRSASLFRKGWNELLVAFDRVARTDPGGGARLLATTFDRHLKMGLDEALTASQVILQDRTVPLERRWELYETLMRFDELNQIAEYLKHDSPVAIRMAVAPLVQWGWTQRTDVSWRDLYQPRLFDHPFVREHLSKYPLGLINQTATALENMGGQIMNPGNLAKIDPALDGAQRVWKKLVVDGRWGRVPLPAHSFPPKGQITIAVWITNMTVDMKLLMRFSNRRVMTLRNRPESYSGELYMFPEPAQESFLEKADILTLTFPATVIAGCRDHLDLSLRGLTTRKSSTEFAWLYRLAIATAPAKP